MHSGSTSEIVALLAEQVRQIEGARPAACCELLGCGWPALDRLLPERGFRRGWLVECLGAAGDGAGTFALALARQAAGSQGTLVAIDRLGTFYPPAAERLGIALERLIVVRPQNDADCAWAIDQSLGWPGVAAVWCLPGEQDEHTFRRWQLAAETSGAVGLLVRQPAVRREPCWAQLRLLVEPIATRPIATRPSATQPIATRALAASGSRAIGRRRRLRVELVRGRGAVEGGSVEIEFPPRASRVETSETSEASATVPSVPSAEAKHETRPVHLAAKLAAAKTRRRSRRA